jgi:quercetin dioxygenase-like cupin family protein
MELYSFNEKVLNSLDIINYQEAGVVSKAIIKQSGGNVTLFAFDEGQFLSEHTAPFDAMVHIIEGNAEIIIAGTIYNVNSGEFIIMPANKPHALKANSKFKMILTMIKDK